MTPFVTSLITQIPVGVVAMTFDGGNYVEKLKLIVPPPVHPLYIGSDDAWLQAEQLLGHRFPRDYRSLLSIYGLGVFGHWLHIDDPFPYPSRYGGVFGRTRLTRENAAVRIGPGSTDEIPSSDVVTIGSDENGNLLHWHIVGDNSEQWPLIYASLDGLDVDYMRMSLTQFLFRWLSREIVPAVIAHWDILSERGAKFCESKVRPK